MSATIAQRETQNRLPANLRWWLLAILAPPLIAWTWYQFGEPVAWVIGIATTALVVRQFRVQQGRRFYPQGLAATGILVLAIAVPLFSWRAWTAIEHRRLVAKIRLIEEAGGVSGWDPSRILFKGDAISNANLTSIAELTGTKELDLYLTRIDDDGLSAINSWSQLESLSIADCPISDQGLAHLSNLTSLERLYLHSNGVSDAGLQYLNNLNRLEHLTIQSNSVSAGGIKKLQQELPNCRIDLIAMPADAPNAEVSKQ
jgi:hypothetical protein